MNNSILETGTIPTRSSHAVAGEPNLTKEKYHKNNIVQRTLW